MARSGIRARRDDQDHPAATIGRRVVWVAVAGLWVFFVVALASFDSADWPSHTVAVHNQPSRNLCGAVGALIAYYSYQVVGVGSWVILLGGAGYLAVIAAGRSLGNPLVRSIGLLLMALAVSGLHGLLAPQHGLLVGARAGLIAQFIVSELSPRFSTVGTFLVLLAGFGIGSIVAIDRVVLAMPRVASTTWSAARRILTIPRFGNLRARPEHAIPRPWTSRRGRPRSTRVTVGTSASER